MRRDSDQHATEHARIVKALPKLENQFSDKPVAYVIPLGDNWLAAWNWARSLERDEGIDHQHALRVARDRYFVRADD